MDKFTWIVDTNKFNDVRMLELLMNYLKKENGDVREYEVSENVYKAMRSLIQGALKQQGFSYLIGEKQDIVLFSKKHFRINKGDEEIMELALSYGAMLGIDRNELEKALKEA